jgi:hypothetical protein
MDKITTTATVTPAAREQIKARTTNRVIEADNLEVDLYTHPKRRHDTVTDSDARIDGSPTIEELVPEFDDDD